MAIDTADNQTQDAFKRGRGRPRTSNPEKKRADAAERQFWFRYRQKLRNIAMRGMTEDPASVQEWISFLEQVNDMTKNKPDNGKIYSMSWEKGGVKYHDDSMSFDDLKVIIEDGSTNLRME